MKKLLTILLILTLALSVTVFAEEAPKNYGADVKWTGMSCKIEVVDGVVTATEVKNAWSSPMADILPAIKTVLGTNDEAEIVIAFDVHATFTEGNEGEFITGNVLLRGDNGLDVSAADTGDWTEAYEKTLDGEEPFFTNPDSNIRHHFGGIKAEMTDDEWMTIEIPLTLQKIHVDNTAVKSWKICFDGLSDTKIVNTIELKNFGIYLADEYESTEPEDPEEPETPAEPETPQEPEKPEAEATPTPTPSPASTKAPQTPNAPLQTPDLNIDGDDEGNNEGGMSPIVIAGIVAAVVVVGAVVAVVVIKKKKTDDK